MDAKAVLLSKAVLKRTASKRLMVNGHLRAAFDNPLLVIIVHEQILSKDSRAQRVLEELCKVCYYVKRLKTICF